MNQRALKTLVFCIAGCFFSGHSQATTPTQPVVPGTGTHIDYVGDDLEGTPWDFIHNHPKSSRENDDQTRFPRGRSTNGRWFEGPERGQPDLMRIVPTPSGGLPHSEHSLLVRTLHSGVPGVRNFKVEQDDLIVDCVSRIGTIPVAETPSIVARVYLPPADQWENRSGPHFGFRGTTSTMRWTTKEPRQVGRFRARSQTVKEREHYWPGIWVHFRSQTDRRSPEDSAFLTVRGNRLGRDFPVRDIRADEFGWWTLGMSFTPNGEVHYYARPGIDDLTEEDHLTSQFPYSYQAQRFETMFFDFCNQNDGRSWSTPFVIDDPRLYLLHADRVRSVVNRQKQLAAQQLARLERQKANASGR